MPIKKGRNRRWWEPRVPPKNIPDYDRHLYERQYSDARLLKIVRSLHLTDSRRLAQLIYEDIEKARQTMKGLPALRERLTGRRHRKHGPKRKVQVSDSDIREFRELYDEIASLVQSRRSAEDLARDLGCSPEPIRYALAHRKGILSKARGVMLAGLGVSPADAAQDDYLYRLLKPPS